MSFNDCRKRAGEACSLRNPLNLLLVLALVALLLGCFGEASAFFAAGALLGLIVLGILWPAIAIGSVRGQLRWPCQRGTEGEHVPLQLDMSNHRPWPVWGLMITPEEGLVDLQDSPIQPAALAWLPAFARTRFEWQAKLPRRGRYPRQNSTVATAFPFGLWKARRRLSIEGSMIVWPQTVELKTIPMDMRGEPASDGIGVDRPGNDGDSIGARNFRPGDSLRSIHWAHSAKLDEFVVRERQSIVQRTLRLEVWPSPSPPRHPTDRETQEWLFRIAGSIARMFLNQRWQVELDLAKSTYCLPPGRQSVTRVLDILAQFNWDTHSGFDRGSTRHPTIGGSNGQRRHASDLPWTIALATTTTYHHATASSTGRSPGKRWIIVDENQHLRSIDPGWSWMTIDTGEPVWTQLQQQWNHYVRRSTVRSLASASCRCE
jgi:uncharacterized protein (DUF58 family)